MPKSVTYANEVSPRFGTPWCDLLKYENGVVDIDPVKLRDRYPTNEDIEKMPQLEIDTLDYLIKVQDRVDTDSVELGYSLDMWERVFDLWKETEVFVIFGGNRSTKSTLASRIVIWLMKTIPECEIRCWHVNQKRSREDQQRFVYEAISDDMKRENALRPARDRWSYSQKNGFTGDKLILPPQPGFKRGSSCIFQHYKSWLHDNQVAEGFNCHFIWPDEEIPGKLFDTLQLRLSDFKGKMMLTFTTLQGWTDVVTTVLDGAKTDVSRNGLEEDTKEKLPLEQTSKKVNQCKILYFWSDFNPFIPPGSVRKRVSGYSRSHRMARLYGIPERVHDIQFVKFNDYNIIEPNELPWVDDSNYPVTHYHLCDPAGNRMWSMIWVAVDQAGTWWIWRDWPDFANYGPWCEPWVNGNGVPVGKQGSASKGQGYGYKDYAWHIKQIEKDEMQEGAKVFERLMDPRFGSHKVPKDDMQSTVLNDINSMSINLEPCFRSGPGFDIHIGLEKINSLLAWDTEKPMNAMNAPKLFITSNCENTIYCMMNYTAKLGYDEKTKDFPDCIRMGATVLPDGIEYISPMSMTTTGGFAY